MLRRSQCWLRNFNISSSSNLSLISDCDKNVGFWSGGNGDIMTPLVKKLKERLANFLLSPDSEEDFRLWFASTLLNVHNEGDSEAESFVHQVQRTFSDGDRGFYTQEQLVEVLSQLSKVESHAEVAKPLADVVQNHGVFRQWNYESSQGWRQSPDEKRTSLPVGGNYYSGSLSPSGSLLVPVADKLEEVVA